MQTFLPYPSFLESAKVLDNKRLGKQRVEAYQILKTLLQRPYICTICKSIVEQIDYESELGCRECGGKVRKTPWYNHPAVQMWKGHEQQLKLYFNTIVGEWIVRGFKNNMKLYNTLYSESSPPWLGNKKFHASHRSNLLRKDPKYYGQFGWTEPNNLPYYWPTKED